METHEIQVTTEFGRLTAQTLRDRGINAVWCVLPDGSEHVTIMPIATDPPSTVAVYHVSDFEDDTGGPTGAATRIMNKMWNTARKRGEQYLEPCDFDGWKPS